MERFRSLLKMVGLDDRLVTKKVTVDVVPQSSLKDALERVENLKDSSIQFLKDNLQ